MAKKEPFLTQRENPQHALTDSGNFQKVTFETPEGSFEPI